MKRRFDAVEGRNVHLRIEVRVISQRLIHLLLLFPVPPFRGREQVNKRVRSESTWLTTMTLRAGRAVLWDDLDLYRQRPYSEFCNYIEQASGTETFSRSCVLLESAHPFGQSDGR